MNDSPLSHREATEAKMGKRRYVVKLNADERQQLKELTCKGKSPAKQQLKARILLQADESPPEQSGVIPKFLKPWAPIWSCVQECAGSGSKVGWRRY
jgi:hypothetical protein